MQHHWHNMQYMWADGPREASKQLPISHLSSSGLLDPYHPFRWHNGVANMVSLMQRGIGTSIPTMERLWLPFNTFISEHKSFPFTCLSTTGWVWLVARWDLPVPSCSEHMFYRHKLPGDVREKGSKPSLLSDMLLVCFCADRKLSQQWELDLSVPGSMPIK